MEAGHSITTAPDKPHYNAIDGLRTFAVAGVIMFHCFVPHAGGGLLGVDVFFVISGFVITLTLLREYDRREKINLPAFYLRRFFRLMPALVLAIAFGAVVELGTNVTSLAAYAKDSGKAITYTYNLFQAADSGHGIDLSHLWSLGVEEQFYLVWAPLLALILARVIVRRRVRVAIGLVLAFWLSQILTTAILGPTASFFLPWSRFDELLLGAVLALSIHTHPKTTVTRLLGSDAVAVAAIVGILAIVAARPPGFGLFLNYAGYLLVASLSAVLIGHIYVRNGPQASPVSAVFSWSPLVWLGKRSYGIYLYHVPIVLAVELNGHGWEERLVAAAFGATLVAALSYRIVERPTMRAGHRWIANRFPGPEVDVAPLAVIHASQPAA